ncbi:Bis-ABC ATPase YheS, partial [hydrothermal vent metagenome]
PTDRIGLIGNNGTGKSTLLKIIAGAQDIDGGTISIASSKKIEYLSQEIAGQESHMPLLEYLCAAKKELTDIEEEMERLSALLETDSDETISHRLCDLQEKYEHLGGYTKEAEARQIVSGLGFSKSDYDKKLSEFSGGFRMRAHLGRLLFSSPDLLLLDEPTNHLDIESTEWLEGFITRKFGGALVIVSHDRYFLNRMVDKIAEVENNKVTLWAYNYDRYQIEKEKRKKIIEKAAGQQASEIEKTERFIERFRAKSTKAKQVKSRIKSLEKIERIVTDKKKKSIGFTFRSTSRGNDILLSLESVGKAYGPNVVYKSLDFKIKRGERIALVGPNGAGKSTLLKLCAGIIEPDDGAITFGSKTERGWFAQHQLEALDVTKTLYEEISSSVSFESQP